MKKKVIPLRNVRLFNFCIKDTSVLKKSTNICSVKLISHFSSFQAGHPNTFTATQFASVQKTTNICIMLINTCRGFVFKHVWICKTTPDLLQQNRMLEQFALVTTLFIVYQNIVVLWGIRAAITVKCIKSGGGESRHNFN